MSCKKCSNTRKSIASSIKKVVQEPSKENVQTVAKKTIVGVKRILKNISGLRK